MIRTVEDINSLKKEIRHAAKKDRISANRYELMMDDLNDRRQTLVVSKNSRLKTKKPQRRNTSKGKSENKVANNSVKPPDNQVTIGEDGYSYWEDSNGQWWVKMSDGDWKEWND
jgi:hypothetical protein